MNVASETLKYHVINRLNAGQGAGRGDHMGEGRPKDAKM